jgi:hypothetical protein
LEINNVETKPFWAFADLGIGGLEGGCDAEHGEDTAAGNSSHFTEKKDEESTRSRVLKMLRGRDPKANREGVGKNLLTICVDYNELHEANGLKPGGVVSVHVPDLKVGATSGSLSSNRPREKLQERIDTWGKAQELNSRMSCVRQSNCRTT